MRQRPPNRSTAIRSGVRMLRRRHVSTVCQKDANNRQQCLCPSIPAYTPRYLVLAIEIVSHSATSITHDVVLTGDLWQGKSKSGARIVDSPPCVLSFVSDWQYVGLLNYLLYSRVTINAATVTIKLNPIAAPARRACMPRLSSASTIRQYQTAQGRRRRCECC